MPKVSYMYYKCAYSSTNVTTSRTNRSTHVRLTKDVRETETNWRINT